MKRMFISDIHVGDGDSEFSKALDIITMENPKELYLLGDIFDLWQIDYNAVLKRYGSFLSFLYKLSSVINVTYVIGNHDADVPYKEHHFSRMRFVCRKDILLSDGKKLRILHGHTYDEFVMHFFPLARFLSWINGILFRWFGIDLRRFKFSLSRQKGSQVFIKAMDAIKQRAMEDNRDVDILIMGHTHIPGDIPGGLRYINTGDWLGDNTYVIEEEGEICLKKCPSEA